MDAGSTPARSIKNKRQKRFIAYKASKSKPFEGFHEEKWKPFSRRFIRVKASLRQDSNLQVKTFMSSALFSTERNEKGRYSKYNQMNKLKLKRALIFKAD